MFKLFTSVMFAGVLGSGIVGSSQSQVAPNGIHLNSGRLYLDGNLQHEGFTINQSEFKFLFFYIPGEGLFTVSDQEFKGALKAGLFEDRTISFRVDDKDVKIESASPILDVGTAPCWAKYDPGFKLDIKSVMIGYGGKEDAPYDWPNQIKK
ncbi:MAG TPA: hypothetical protein VI756_16830 [Blastocatellia bacterium]